MSTVWAVTVLLGRLLVGPVLVAVLALGSIQVASRDHRSDRSATSYFRSCRAPATAAQGRRAGRHAGGGGGSRQSARSDLVPRERPVATPGNGVWRERRIFAVLSGCRPARGLPGPDPAGGLVPRRRRTDRRPESPFRIVRVILLDVQAVPGHGPADGHTAATFGRSLARQCLFYLGQDSGTTILYNHRLREPIRVPSDSVAITDGATRACGGHGTARPHPGTAHQRRPDPDPDGHRHPTNAADDDHRHHPSHHGTATVTQHHHRPPYGDPHVDGHPDPADHDHDRDDDHDRRRVHVHHHVERTTATTTTTPRRRPRRSPSRSPARRATGRRDGSARRHHRRSHHRCERPLGNGRQAQRSLDGQQVTLAADVRARGDRPRRACRSPPHA